MGESIEICTHVFNVRGGKLGMNKSGVFMNKSLIFICLIFIQLWYKIKYYGKNIELGVQMLAL